MGLREDLDLVKLCCITQCHINTFDSPSPLEAPKLTWLIPASITVREGISSVDILAWAPSDKTNYYGEEAVS